MGSRLSILLLTAVCVWAAAPSGARASDECPAGRTCFSLSVPLDRTGAVPGTVTLWVERIAAQQATRPPLLLIARGPGYSATWLFDDEQIEGLFPAERRSRDIVLLDLRGTGRSGPLDCPALQAKPNFDWSSGDVAGCAASLGPRHAFHTASDSAADIDAVRSSLGADEIALYGDVSGAGVALEYARRHPERVERLLLQSPRSAGPFDPLYRTSLQAVSRVLAETCADGRCQSATQDVVADVRTLAARLERQPLSGTLIDDPGGPGLAEIDGYGLLNLIADAELDPFVLAELPGVVHNALRGDPLPLLRSYHRWRDLESRPAPAREPLRHASFAAYLATRCAQAELPWTSSTPLAERVPQAQWLAASLPAGVFGPFGAPTALSGAVERCASWPAARDGEPADPLPLPDVPALIVAGERSVVAPVEMAREVAAELPGAHVLTVPGSGYDVLGGDPDDCEQIVVGRFLAGEQPAPGERWRCPGDPAAEVWPVDPIPTSLADLPADLPTEGDAGEAGRTLAAVRRTAQDAFANLYFELSRRDPDSSSQELRVGGLRGGAYVLGERAPNGGRLIHLEGASVVEGVDVTGWMTPYSTDLAQSRGRFAVAGETASPGLLTLRDGVLSGRLGDRTVRGPLTMDLVDVAGFGPRP